MIQQDIGLDWQKDFTRLTPSEFFRKNKQMLGFTGKIRSLTIVFHELITNSFDAAEESGILPDIDIELKRVDKEHYILKHKDNGPGIPEKYILISLFRCRSLPHESRGIGFRAGRRRQFMTCAEIGRASCRERV